MDWCYHLENFRTHTSPELWDRYTLKKDRQIRPLKTQEQKSLGSAHQLLYVLGAFDAMLEDIAQLRVAMEKNDSSNVRYTVYQDIQTLEDVGQLSSELKP